MDILEVLEARVIGVRRDGKRVLGSFEVRTDHDHGAVGVVGFAIGCLSRHPVAEKYVDVLVLHGRERHRDRQHGDARAVTYGVQQLADEGRGRGHIGPPDIGEAYVLAARRIAGGFRRSGSRGAGDRRDQRGGGDGGGSHGSLDPAAAGTA